MKRLSLRLRLVLLSTGVTALVVGVAFLALRYRAVADVRKVFAAELASGQRALRGIQEGDLQLLLATSALVSTSPTLRAALETARVEADAGLPARSVLLATIRREAERLFADLDRDLLVVTDERGGVLVSVSRNVAGAPRELERTPAVRYALNAEVPRPDSSFAVIRINGAPFQVGCAAIVLQGYPIGVLVLGDRLDRIVPRLGAAAGNDIIITEGDEVLAAHPARRPDEVRSLIGGATADTMPHRSELRGEEYVIASLALGTTAGGRRVTMHLLRSLGAALEPLEGALGRSFLLAGGLAVLLAGLGAAAAAGSTLEPLHRFVEFLRRGADRGAYDQFQEAGAPAEIRSLTATYNALIASLSRQHAQIEERSQQLAAANESLVEEIAHRARAEESLRASEEALRQSQKLEALGTLAGGVAHDFNNLITVINGYVELLSHEIGSGSPVRRDLNEIRHAAERASGLVRQLLAFGRKQVLQPRVVDLNKIVTGMENMLGRLIGEDVHLVTRLEDRLARITADPGSLEQIIMNLVVNGRDAMPRGGRLTIETANVSLGAEYEQRPDAIRAGPAVLLSVSDTGEGMDAATRARIFEPFFTTKEAGKGTGLGLATVYGIVRQSGGSISVHSEPGSGTTFRIYFRPAARSTEAADAGERGGAWTTGSETVLIAEDEEQVRHVLERTLARAGYRVLAAGGGAEALAIAEQNDGSVALLLADVIMPVVSGQELVARLRERWPRMPVVFLSGYSDEAVTRHGVLAEDTVFLQKPVPPEQLLRTVRRVIDAADGRGGGDR